MEAIEDKTVTVACALGSWLMFQVLAGVWGFKEGILYSRKGADAFHWNEHLVFWVERIFAYLLWVAGFITGMLAVTGRLWLVLTMGVSALLCFPFFHDELYNLCRFLINNKKWVYGYQSPTTSALIDLPKLPRLLCLIAGLLLLSIYLYVRFA
jgi:hypothetical protein